jgi:ankyrin repeat protein
MSSLLCKAAKTGDITLIDNLLKSKDIDINEKEGLLLRTALMLASQNGHKDIVYTLLAHKADVNFKDVRIIFKIKRRYI